MEISPWAQVFLLALRGIPPNRTLNSDTIFESIYDPSRPGVVDGYVDDSEYLCVCVCVCLKYACFFFWYQAAAGTGLTSMS